jgi:hypothetical protein
VAGYPATGSPSSPPRGEGHEQHVGCSGARTSPRVRRTLPLSNRSCSLRSLPVGNRSMIPAGCSSLSPTATAACSTSPGRAAVSGQSGGTSSSDLSNSAIGYGKSCRSKRQYWMGRSCHSIARDARTSATCSPAAAIFTTQHLTCSGLGGRDLRGLPLLRRKKALTGLIPATTTLISQVFSIEERERDLFDAAQRLDLEGIVDKRSPMLIPKGSRGITSRTGRTPRARVGGSPRAMITDDYVSCSGDVPPLDPKVS